MYAVAYRSTMKSARFAVTKPKAPDKLIDLSKRWQEKQREIEDQRRRANQEAQNVAAISAYRVIEWNPSRPPVRELIARVAAFHGVSYAEIVGVSRFKKIVQARFDAIRAVADARPDMSLPAIGRIFNRDHTTIIHALRKTKLPGQVR